MMKQIDDRTASQDEGLFGDVVPARHRTISGRYRIRVLRRRGTNSARREISINMNFSENKVLGQQSVSGKGGRDRAAGVIRSSRPAERVATHEDRRDRIRSAPLRH